jgi:glycine/D-amino acid oxidase-like deaminating enzyme
MRMSACSILETLETRVGGDYDVVVAGGGASGLVATLAAARAGARTALIERTGSLGGTATAAMVAQWLGFYNRETRVVGGLAMELARRVCELGGSDGFARYTLAEASANPIPLIHFPFNPEILKIVADEAVQEAGVDVLLHSQVVRPLLLNQRVEGVAVETPSGRTALRAKIVVDATGDAAVAAASGIPCAGEEADLRQHRQPCTLVFRISNVDVKRFRAIPRDVKRAIALEGLRAGRLFWESLSFCSTPGGTDAICLMSRISGVDALDDDDLTRAAMTGRQQVKSIVGFLRERVPGFEHSVLAGIAERVGVRETRRIQGQYTLTQEDIINNVCFPDAIALGAGPMDLHEADGTSIAMWVPQAPFEIPLRCLLPLTIDGLVVTGRAISATREANSGSRHMGTAMCLGEAAGMYAALSARGEAQLARPPYERLRQMLRAQGALISVEDAFAAARVDHSSATNAKEPFVIA